MFNWRRYFTELGISTVGLLVVCVLIFFQGEYTEKEVALPAVVCLVALAIFEYLYAKKWHKAG